MLKHATARALLITLAALVSLAGCVTGRPNPVASADRPEVVALALYGSFVIVEEAAADVAEHPSTPVAVRAGLIAADEVAAPVFAQLRPVAEEVQRIRAELAVGASTEEKLAISIASLNNWITRAAPLLRDLSAAVAKAKGAP